MQLCLASSGGLDGQNGSPSRGAFYFIFVFFLSIDALKGVSYLEYLNNLGKV